MIPSMREGDSGRVEPLIVGEDGNDDRGYLSMLFSDLGDFPPAEGPIRVEAEEPVEPAATAAAENPQILQEAESRNGNGAGSHLGPNGALTVKPQTVRPFIEEVLNVPTAPEAGASQSRWRMAAVSVVAFLALAGTGAAVLSMGYQASVGDGRAVPARAGVFPQLAEESESRGVDSSATNLPGFQGCTKGEGLSPLGLMVVARDFVSTSTAPAVCLPAEAPRKKAARDRKPKPAADRTTSTSPVTETTPSGSSGSGGSAPSPGSGSGESPGTGTGGGGTEPTPSPAPPPPPPPPSDGGTTEPDKSGNGWGKGGKPKGP